MTIQNAYDDGKKAFVQGLDTDSNPYGEKDQRYYAWLDGYSEGHINAQMCRVCGCTDDWCPACIKKLGHPCHWVEDDLCSACIDEDKKEATIWLK